MLAPNDHAPWFVARSTVNPTFHFDTAAGRNIVLCFLGSASDPRAAEVIADVDRHGERFDAANLAFFGVSIDPDDERLGRVQQLRTGVVWFWDFDYTISRAYGVLVENEFTPVSIVLDHALRVVAVVPIGDDAEAHLAKVLSIVDRLTPYASLPSFAPVLSLTGIFEREFCDLLVGLYDRHGGEESGFMRDIGGKTMHVSDYSHKRRTDYEITDQQVIREAQLRLHRRLVPEIKKAFQFSATRIERHIVACYDAQSGGHFRPHRDNTTRGTAHRRFAVTINLNSEGYEGGDLRFPEFGPRTYRAPTGGAVVFSCSLLHEAMPVTAGKRYAFLPFLYDDEAAKIRQANQQYLAER